MIVLPGGKSAANEYQKSSHKNLAVSVSLLLRPLRVALLSSQPDAFSIWRNGQIPF
jgi:hypothetical protein